MQKAKTLSLISIIIGLLAVITLVASVFTVTNGSVFDIAFISMVADENEIAQAKANLANSSQILIEATDEEKAEFEQTTGLTVENVIKDFETFSLNDMIKYSSYEEVGVPAELVKEFELIRTIIVAYAAVIGIFSLLAALLKCRPLTYIAMTISLLYFIFLAGLVYLIVFLALSITHIVLVTKAKIAKKEAYIPVAHAM